MKSNENVVVATGGWNSTKLKALPCAESPKGEHYMVDVSSRKSTCPDERLVTSQCKHCGCRIVDCPTINA